MIRSLLTTLACLGLALIALTVVRPGWASVVGLDLWNLPLLNGEIAEQENISARLDRQQIIVLARLAAKEEVLHELLAEQITLVEAAEEFRRLDQTPVESIQRAPEYSTGRTEGERYCREVIQWVRFEPEDNPPGRMERIARRLEAELEVYLSNHAGEVNLTAN